MYTSTVIKNTKRKSLTFFTAKTISNLGYRLLSENIIELPEELKLLKKQQAVFIYMGLHKSLWETSGVLSCLHLNGLPIPYIGMGDNLVRGDFILSLVEKCGVFFIKRANNRKEILESARSFKKDVKALIFNGIDSFMFPEGTRKSIPQKHQYGDFFPTAFEGVIEYEKERRQDNNNTYTHQAYIIPFNVDYSRVREDHEMLNQHKPQTLHVFDSLKWMSRIGKTYISFGRPIAIADHIDKNRKELAVYTKKACLNLVKILPINIVSRAVCDMFKEHKNDIHIVHKNISHNLEKLSTYQDRFRDLSIDSQAQKLLQSVAKKIKAFREIDYDNLPLYQLYADYVNHYFD